MLEQLEKEVVQWAIDKGIPLNQLNALKQLGKTQEELSELRDEVVACNIVDGNADHIKLELGDVLVTLCLQAAIWDTTLEECLQLALNKITKRTGKIVNGVFVKDGD